MAHNIYNLTQRVALRPDAPHFIILFWRLTILFVKRRVQVLNARLTDLSDDVCPDAPYFIILLCLMQDNFTRQGEGVDA
jgi:hypothetical protein